MKPEAPPIERFYDLDDLGQAGADVAIRLKADDLARVARWARVDSVESLAAEIALSRISPARFKLDYEVEADITQTCVVTLEPVRSHVSLRFSRELHVLSPRRRKAEEGGLVIVAAAEDDTPEEIESPRYDLAGPLLEELSLAIDPYPRVPGVAFEPPGAGQGADESPFAVLKALKERR